MIGMRIISDPNAFKDILERLFPKSRHAHPAIVAQLRAQTTPSPQPNFYKNNLFGGFR